MAYFIASKCFAAKTGSPNGTPEVGRSGFSNCGRSSLFESCRETSWNDAIVYSDVVSADNGGRNRTNQVQVGSKKV